MSSRWLRAVGASDSRLAALAAEGEERAFEALVRRYDAALRGYCAQLLGQREDAEDALQEALAAAHAALRSDGPPREPRAWLFAIARNRCLSMLRARAPEPVPLPEIATVGVAEVVQSRVELRAMVDDLGRLDRDAREALVLTRLGDLDHRQVAEILGCKPERVRSLVRQARIELAAARLARDATCEEIRAELAELRRGGFRRAHIRRHLAACETCRAFRRTLAAQDDALGLVLPLPAAVAVTAAHGGLAIVSTKAASSLAIGVALVAGAGVAVTVEKSAPPPAVADARPPATAPRPSANARVERPPATGPRATARPAGRASRPKQRSAASIRPTATPRPDRRPVASEPEAAPTPRPAPRPSTPGPSPSSPPAEKPPASEPAAPSPTPASEPAPPPPPPEPTPTPSPKPDGGGGGSYTPQPPMPPVPAPPDDASGTGSQPPPGGPGGGPTPIETPPPKP